jgi:hypothetical protein
MRVDNVFSTAFSTVPCRECTSQQVCVVSSANAPGYCACPFRDVEVSREMVLLGRLVSLYSTKQPHTHTHTP